MIAFDGPRFFFYAADPSENLVPFLNPLLLTAFHYQTRLKPTPWQIGSAVTDDLSEASEKALWNRPSPP